MIVKRGGSGVANKEAAKTVALAMEKEAVAASAEELMAIAPVGKDRAAVESIKQDLTGLEGSLSAIHQLIEKGDYLGAEAQAKVLKDKEDAVSDEIQRAIEKAKGRGKKTRSPAQHADDTVRLDKSYEAAKHTQLFEVMVTGGKGSREGGVSVLRICLYGGHSLRDGLPHRRVIP